MGGIMKKILFGCLSLFSIVQAQDTEPIAYEFSGKHFLASYLHCDSAALKDIDHLLQAMEKAVNASGATILDKSSYVFSPDGLTVVYLLSESHASLHTYPEYDACFVDLFTCGNNCSAEKFDRALRSYLHPQEVNARYLKRDVGTEEIAYLLE